MLPDKSIMICINNAMFQKHRNIIGNRNTHSENESGTGITACIGTGFTYFHVKQTINCYSHRVCDVCLLKIGLVTFFHFYTFFQT